METFDFNAAMRGAEQREADEAVEGMNSHNSTFARIAAGYYKSLKEQGLPEALCISLTEQMHGQLLSLKGASTMMMLMQELAAGGEDDR